MEMMNWLDKHSLVISFVTCAVGYSAGLRTFMTDSLILMSWAIAVLTLGQKIYNGIKHFKDKNK